MPGPTGTGRISASIYPGRYVMVVSKSARVSPVIALLAMAALAALFSASVPAGPGDPRRAVIVSIDGLRPDVLLRARAPTLRGLMGRGSFSMWATTTPAAVTLPSHVSMLTGVTPRRHGVEWNSDLPLSQPIW